MNGSKKRRRVFGVSCSDIDQSKNYVLIATLENAANAEIICTKRKVDLILIDIETYSDQNLAKTGVYSLVNFQIFITSYCIHNSISYVKY